MKQSLLFIMVLAISFVQAQTVNIPDSNFLNQIIISGVDTSGDGQIQISEATNYTGAFNLYSDNIADLTGLEAFVNLSALRISNSPITFIDVSANTQLTELYSYNCPLTYIDISTNTMLQNLTVRQGDLNSVDISNSINLTVLDLTDNNISSIDVSNHPLLQALGCGGNNLSTIDVSSNPALAGFNMSNNNLISLDVTNNPMLNYLSFAGNPISDIDLSNNNLIEQLYSQNTQISELNLSNMTNLEWAYLAYNPNLVYINIRNGNNDAYFIGEGPFVNLPNLEVVCVDDVTSEFAANINQTGHPVTFTDNCNVVPGLHNEISGAIKLDFDADGCDSTFYPMGNRMVVSDNGTDSFATLTQANGSYLLYTNDGNFTTTTTLSLPPYFTVSPASQSSNFVGFDNTDISDFCVDSTTPTNSLDVTLLPISVARPGFVYKNQIIINSSGTSDIAPSVTLEYDTTKVSFLNSEFSPTSQTSNSITFDYNNLQPFETVTIDLEWSVATPPTVDDGDILSFTATVNPVLGDYIPDDNVFVLNQEVVNSYDPNDITVLEGSEIAFEDVDKYLNYLIRFQNEGTASAVDIIVNTILDANLDWNTFQLLDSSHDTRVAIKNGNDVDFIFEDINLPDSATNEALSNGYIAYRVKPKSTVNIGDVITADADIYFDFNQAIQTNTVSTEIVNVLSIEDHELASVAVFPNPTDGLLRFKSQSPISTISVYNQLGQLATTETNVQQIDLSAFSKGVYAVELVDIQGRKYVRKVIIK